LGTGNAARRTQRHLMNGKPTCRQCFNFKPISN
jgi:hypothetical protein